MCETDARGGVQTILKEPFLSDLTPVTAGSSPGVCDRGLRSGA